jgi:Kef-type K+ transport system membrane component KefB
MRRALILGLLLIGMQMVLPLGVAGHHSQSLLTFGFLILAAYTVGEIAIAARQPRIVGYLAAGLLFGPSVLNVVSADSLRMLAPINSLAIALIAFLAGAELRWEEVKPYARVIARILIAEIPLTFALLAALLFALRPFVPFLAGIPLPEAVAFSLLFAAMGVVHSPAVTMGVLSETGARGPVARTVLGVVLVSDVVIVLLFAATLSVAQALSPPPATGGTTAQTAALAWELGGAVVVGSALGAAVAVYIRFVKRELFLFAIMVAFFGAEVARLVHVEFLLTLLIAGVVTENVSRRADGLALRGAMERAADPVFVVFFTLAGASLNLREVIALWQLIVPIVLVRGIGLWLGTRIGARWAEAAPEITRLAWMGLVSQAGVAIGFATVVAEIYPERGASMKTLFLATLAVNQFLGPVLFKRALTRAREVVSGGLSATPAPAAN